MLKWPKLSPDCASPNDNEETNDTQEVLEDILIRALTREYIDVFRVALIGGSLPANNMMEMEDSSMDTPLTSRNTVMTEVISDLGNILLRNEKTCVHIVLTILG